MKKLSIRSAAAIIGTSLLMSGAALTGASAQNTHTATSPEAAQAARDNQIGPKWSEVSNKLESQGFVIREMDKQRDGWKVDVTDIKGQRFELRLNPAGDIVDQNFQGR